MTSFISEIATAQTMPAFKVKVEVYHKADSLLSFPGGQHEFLQMYLIDEDNDELNASWK